MLDAYWRAAVGCAVCCGKESSALEHALIAERFHRVLREHDCPGQALREQALLAGRGLAVLAQLHNYHRKDRAVALCATRPRCSGMPCLRTCEFGVWPGESVAKLMARNAPRSPVE